MRALSLLLALALLSGCKAHHVRLEAPAPSAPLDARLEAYQRLRPMAMAETRVTNYGVLFGRRQRFIDYLELADGTRVGMPEDILPVVAADSEAAHSVRESLERRERWRALRIATPIVAAIGVGLAIAGFRVEDSALRKGFLIGGGVTLGLALSLQIGQRYVRQAEENWENEAYLAYDRGLRARLNVCLEGQDQGPCAEAPRRGGEWEQAPESGPAAPDAPGADSGWEQVQ